MRTLELITGHVIYNLSQRDRTRRALLQYQNFDFLFYLGWSGSFPQSNNYIMKVVQYPSTEINVAGFGVRTTVLWHENLEHYPQTIQATVDTSKIYIYLALWRVINFPKESLSLFSLYPGRSIQFHFSLLTQLCLSQLFLLASSGTSSVHDKVGHVRHAVYITLGQ